MIEKDDATVWIPAIPLPFFARTLLGRSKLVCYASSPGVDRCGATFKGRDRQLAYERHYVRAHSSPLRKGDVSPEPRTMMEVSLTYAFERGYTLTSDGHLVRDPGK